MNLDDIMRDIQAMREDMLIFERTYGIPTEIFYESYQRGELPPDRAWILDWSEWAATYELLQDRLNMYARQARQLADNTVSMKLSRLIEQASHRKPVALSHEPIVLSPDASLVRTV
ncbi:MAG: hypothetical protein HC884_00600 [Chloroflexaceae bacterium]|nr:hypothetical protein [Chloroflexaceae bacterium]